MDAVSDYLGYLARHGRKQRTIKTYATALARAEALIKEAGLSADPNDADERTYLAVRTAPGLAETTRRTYVTIYVEFIRWRTGKDLLQVAIPLPMRPEPQTRRWISEAQFRRLWEHADTRVRVVLALGAWMGLRRMEIATVRWEDLRNGRLLVRGKGHGPDGKVVSMLVPDAVMRALEAWRPYCPMNVETILANDSGRAYSPDSIGHMVHELGKSLGIDVSTHSLRRLFACNLDEREVGPIEIAQLMRHESINTTYSCYLKPNRSRLDGIAAGMGAGY